MLTMLKVRKNHGYQAIPDVVAAKPCSKYRGFPLISNDSCTQCGACIATCPSQAILLNPVRIDIGKCVFCGDCQRVCKTAAIKFSSFHKTAADSAGKLILSGSTPEEFLASSIQYRNEIHRLFGRSFKLRQVSAAGCNACESELNACSNVNFDMARFGIEFTASPRHADGVLITGPVSKNMAAALKDTWDATPAPKVLILSGSCAISGGIFQNAPAIDRSFITDKKIDLFIPGCPPHPLSVIHGLMSLMGILKQ